MMIVVIVLIFLLLLLFPFLLSYGVHYDSETGRSLIVKNDNIKDARYFSKSFRNKIKNADVSGKEDGCIGKVKLSKEEDILFYDKTTALDTCIDSICYINAEAEFHDKIEFNKEVYAKENITLADSTVVRAIAGDKKVVIGGHSKIGRWADAEQFLALKEGSDAGISLSSGEKLVIEPDCVFTRLYAPVIEVKKYTVTDETNIKNVVINKSAPVYMKLLRNIKVVEKNQEERHTIVTKYDLTIEKCAVVYGDIKSDKSIRIGKYAVVTGNVFGDGDVIIEQGAKVLGNVFSGANLYIGPNVTIGKTGRIKSALARVNLVIAQGTVIYGYAGCEGTGKTVMQNETDIEINSRAEEFEYEKCNITEEGFLNLDDINDYEEIDYYAFRRCHDLTKVKIPEGALTVGESMFYECENLETVILPDSVEKIENYAFFGCRKLKNVILGKNSRLEKIGEYSFARCISLDCNELNNIKEIGYAAFWESDGAD